MLTGHNPGINGDVRVFAFLTVYHTKIVGNIVRHRSSVVDYFMIVSAGYDAGAASDAPI
jgi:hypothetical protein